MRDACSSARRLSPIPARRETTFHTQSLLGGSLLGQKNLPPDAAEPPLLSGYEGMKEREAKIPPPQGKPRLTEALERLVQLYDAWGKPDQASEWRAKLQAMNGDEKK